MIIVLPDKNEKNIDSMVRAIAFQYPEAHIIVSADPEGKGKGWALRRGLILADSFPIVFIDGDGDILPGEIARLLPYAKYYDIVVGRKEPPKRFKRKFITKFSRLYIKLLFGITEDTQTGLKIFNYKPEWKTDGWGFDIEILYRAKSMNKMIKEVPIHAVVTDSKTLKDLWTTFKDSLKIRFSL